MSFEGSENSRPTIEGPLQGKGGGGGLLEESLSDVLTIRQRLRFKAGDVLLGRYKILGELGQGGMGLVFRCLDEVGGVEVALKMLPPEVSHDTGEMEEVRENFQLVSHLVHQNICEVKTLERDANGEYFLVIEYVPGVSLRQWRKAEARGQRAEARGQKSEVRDQKEENSGQSGIAVETILPILRQIAAALDYAHRQKVIHRDIKPANVMIAPDSGVKVLDFGLATQVHTSMSRVSHVRYGTSGTGPYMAPEQWEGQYQDARTDQYAFAVLAYELLSGRLPFESPDADVLRRAVLGSAPKKPDGMDAKTWAVLKIGLAKERDQRFASCTELVEALGGKKLLPQRSQSSPSKKVWLGLAAVVVLSLLAYLSYRSYSSHAERLAKETAQAAEAARLDAQKRAQAEALQRAAEAALGAGELEQAGAKIAELEQLVGKNGAVVQELNAKYEAKAGERETNSRYAKASLARDAAQKIDRGETLGAKLDELELKWREAEAAHRGKTWGQALKSYDTVLALAKTATEADTSRTSAKTQRAASDAAQKKAESAQAATDAATEFSSAQQQDKVAVASFEQGDFAAASKAWKKAAELFQGSENRALAVQSYRVPRLVFEKALASDAELLKAHGGAQWNAVQEQARLGAASANDPTVGRKAFADALAKLPAAVTEAKESQKQAELESALAAARAARDAQRWKDVVRLAEAALTLESGNTEAKRLKAEAEQNLTPSLKIVVEADGQEVAAKIETGGRTSTSPQTFNLTNDQRYVFHLSYPLDRFDKRRWKPQTLELTADWRGSQTRRVQLEEQRGPALDAPFENSLGMQFVPVPGTKTLFCKWLTRVQDFEAFVKAAGHNMHEGMCSFSAKNIMHGWAYFGDTWESPGYEQGPTSPVCGVSWDDANAFCQWLTEKEKRAGLISAQQEYRLPYDWEWSVAVGLNESHEKTPKEKDGRIENVYPWGTQWPPPDGTANVAGEESESDFRNTSVKVIVGYNDKYQRASPVGRFKPNGFGLFDMGGNLCQWCKDYYDGQGGERVQRGSSWQAGDSSNLLSSRRKPCKEDHRMDCTGFRVVLASSLSE